MVQRRVISNARLLLTAAAAAVSWPVAVTGAPNITTDSAVFVERMDTDLGRQLEPAENLARGDRVVTILRWYRLGGDGDFVITNSLPRTISYQQSSRRDEEVSVNGGKKWGPLGALRVGSRMATPEDVTHVRWRISQRMASIGKGQIAYSGIVR